MKMRQSDLLCFFDAAVSFVIKWLWLIALKPFQNPAASHGGSSYTFLSILLRTADSNGKFVDDIRQANWVMAADILGLTLLEQYHGLVGLPLS